MNQTEENYRKFINQVLDDYTPSMIQALEKVSKNKFDKFQAIVFETSFKGGTLSIDLLSLQCDPLKSEVSGECYVDCESFDFVDKLPYFPKNDRFDFNDFEENFNSDKITIDLVAEWFHSCWDKSDASTNLPVYLQQHDDHNYLNLKTNKWEYVELA